MNRLILIFILLTSAMAAAAPVTRAELIAIRGNGLEWKLEDRRILFYSDPGKLIDHRRRLKSKTHQKLNEIINSGNHL